MIIIRRMVLLSFFIGLTLIISSCEKGEVKVKSEEKVINVILQTVEKRSIRPYIETIGTLIPGEEVIISSEVDGVLKDIRVDEGTEVNKEMVLAIIDDTDYILQVKQAEAILKQAEANLSNISVEYKRKESLYKEGLSSLNEFDDISTRLSLSGSEVERAKASLNLILQRLTKTKIYSPISGIIKLKKVSSGDYVRNGTPLFTVIQNDPLKLSFNVPEKDIGRLKIGQDVQLKVDPYPLRDFKGRLSIIYPGLDERTRSLQAETLINNSGGLLKPGLFARVIIYTGDTREANVVPVNALLYEGDKVKVFAIEEDRAKERYVKVGNKYGGVMEIIEGIKAGEKLVIAGQQNLSEGVKVRVNVAR
ncbi:MAG: hypothetical protein A2Y48_06705 [Nitrospirae bacterium RIFCSPLOW2_12_42_9]|nr:MAG: hypothetical protein A2Y48_06705 [Nitrospirae bacterium RIFCSPLOW2_12_42_9]